MGYAEALTYLPSSHAHYAPLLARHQRHLKRMLELQQPDGSWLQLLDYPVRDCCSKEGPTRCFDTPTVTVCRETACVSF